MQSFDQAIEELILNYQQLNGNHVEELLEVPSHLEFMRYVHKGRPFVVKGAVGDWPAVQWTDEFLENAMAEKKVKVAVTPSGLDLLLYYLHRPLDEELLKCNNSNADAVVRDPESKMAYFVKPLEVEEPFADFIRYIRDQERSRDVESLVKYGQARSLNQMCYLGEVALLIHYISENDNLRGEYSELYKDVGKDIPWARIALGRVPDAINLWVGNSRSVTALHKDNYENIYCQLIGSKHFVLLPPIESPCVNEKLLSSATYTLDGPSNWKLAMETELIPIPTWDPDKPSENTNRFSHLSVPLRVDIDPGDLLYLPALWYHKVSQSCSGQGICCAVNYWYDMEYEGLPYATNAFVHKISSILNNQ